jgi:hypothetical protein
MFTDGHRGTVWDQFRQRDLGAFNRFLTPQVGLSDTHYLVDPNDRPVHPLSRPRGGLRQRVSWRRSCFRRRLTPEGGGAAASRRRGGVT